MHHLAEVVLINTVVDYM